MKIQDSVVIWAFYLFLQSLALDFLEDKLMNQQSDTTLLQNKKGY